MFPPITKLRGPLPPSQQPAPGPCPELHTSSQWQLFASQSRIDEIFVLQGCDAASPGIWFTDISRQSSRWKCPLKIRPRFFNVNLNNIIHLCLGLSNGLLPLGFPTEVLNIFLTASKSVTRLLISLSRFIHPNMCDD
jgi:hypothetical protein